MEYREENENENEARLNNEEKGKSDEAEEDEFESEAGAEEKIEARAELAVSMDVEAESEAELEVSSTVVAAVSAMTSAEMEAMSSAADKLDANLQWVYARVRRAAKKCPTRSVFRLHHHHHHHHAKKYVVPEIYDAAADNVHRHLMYAHYIAGWMKTSIYRMMTPSKVDPLYHSTFGKCHHFDARKLRKRCRRIRMLRKALASPVVEKNHFVTPLLDISAMGSADPAPARKAHRNQRRRRLRHLKKSIRKLARGTQRLGRTLRTLRADITRLTANLNGVKLPATAGTQSPQAQTAANLAHMNKVLNKMRACLPKVMRRLGKMNYDVEKVRSSLGGKRRARRQRRSRRSGRATASDFEF